VDSKKPPCCFHAPSAVPRLASADANDFLYPREAAREIGHAPETLVAERKAPRIAMELRKLARMA
jgi:hypothetical protein